MAVRITCIGETGFTGPIVKIDELESIGSLYLVEPQHPTQQWAEGTPVDGYTIPNVLEKRAAQNGIANSSSNFYSYGMVGNVGLIERSAKGGLHGIMSQVNAGSGDGAEMKISSNVIQYLINNPTNQIYISAWEESTRDGAASQPARLSIGLSDQVDMLAYWYRTNFRPAASDPQVIGIENESFENIVGVPVNQAISVDDWHQSEVPATPNDIFHHFKWGNIGFNQDGNFFASQPSYVFYRMYIEDLTVSGRSHAEVFALDQAAFSAAFGVGGRYENDTYTAPSTIP